MGYEGYGARNWTPGQLSAELANVRWQNTIMKERIREAVAILEESKPNVENALTLLYKALSREENED